MIKKLSILSLITFLFVLVTFEPYYFSVSMVSGEITSNNVIVDGFVGVGEYENSIFLDSLNTYKLSYTVDYEEIYIGIEAEATGWVALGIDPNDPATTRHKGADILMGAYLASSSTTTSADKFGATSEDIKTDSSNGGSNNILSAVARQNNSWTTFEFSRKLITGDSRDKDIIPELGQVVMWAYHRSRDTFGEHHSSNGYTYIIFHEDTFIPPDILDNDSGGVRSFNVIIDGVITPNEYPFSVYMDSLYQFKLHYGIVNNTAYFGLEVKTQGWVAIGFQPNNPASNQHSGADIILGAFDSQTKSTVFRDDYGDTSTTHKRDTILGGTTDLDLVSASESSSGTVLEFSRSLDTVDPYDEIIKTESPQYIMWAYHTSIDDMETAHSAMGYNLLTLHEFSQNFDPNAPTLPFSPQQLSGIFENDHVILNWLFPPFDGNSPIKNYNVYRKLYNEIQYTPIGTNSSSNVYIDTDVSKNLAYYYVVRAENSIGESSNSNELRINLFADSTDNSLIALAQNNEIVNKNLDSSNNDIFSDIPFGLGWAFSIPLIYGAMFLILLGVIKIKRKINKNY